MSKDKRNFHVKMHLACITDELRPIMSHVYFDNGFMVATDAHILIKAKLDKFTDFDHDELQLLEGKFLSKDSFKKVFSCSQVRVTEEGIEDLKTKAIYKFITPEGKYPNYQAVMSGLSPQSIDEIGLQPTIAKRIFDITKCSSIVTVSLHFHGKDKAVFIHSTSHSDNEFTALIMPVALFKN